MSFWKMAFEKKWVTAEALRGAVISEANPFGEITPEEYQLITSIEFA